MQSDSEVDYGSTAALGSSSATNANKVIAHSVGLTGLTSSAQYHYRVRSSGATSADNTFTTSASSGGASAAYLSDLTWSSMSNGWGPAEKDMSNGEQGVGDGKPISIRGTKYSKGIGTHAPSDVRYAVGGVCSTFTATIGIDDEAAPSGSVVFQVWADGTKLYDSGTVTGSSAAKNVSVSLAGKNQLQLVVTDSGDGNAYDHADWANALINCGGKASTTRFLSDLTWTSMTNGWGPAEKDMSNGEQGTGDGRVISMRSTPYPKGLGVHANSDIRYALGGTCSAFSASVGIDDEAAPNGSVIFQVWADGVKLYDSGQVTGSSPVVPVAVNITGKIQLQLVVTDSGDGSSYDHADWANARVTCQ
jgi:hypothetical protein